MFLIVFESSELHQERDIFNVILNMIMYCSFWNLLKHAAFIFTFFFFPLGGKQKDYVGFSENPGRPQVI